VVVNNGPFEAAVYAYSEAEFNVFLKNPQDIRHRECILMDLEVAREESGYNKMLRDEIERKARNM